MNYWTIPAATKMIILERQGVGRLLADLLLLVMNVIVLTTVKRRRRIHFKIKR
jgi:hypothetical protein